MSDIQKKMRFHLDNLTKPVGSLGVLEEIALKLAEIQKKVPPTIGKKGVFVFAGDHGITDEGVSLYPKEVTFQMVLNFLSGGAAINVLSRSCGFDVSVIDSGVAADFSEGEIIDRKVGYGTANFSKEEAMSQEELTACLSHGKALAEKASEDGYNLVAIGDMGIGNTSSAAALCLAGGLTNGIIDKGTGISDETLLHKRSIIEAAIEKHSPFQGTEEIMRKVGGFELATITGFILGLKDRKIACVIDGFPVSAAAYMAYLMDNSVTSYLFAGHESKVTGHRRILDTLSLRPIVKLNMRLGEGTGAVIGGFLIELAAKTASEMASFESAGVAKSENLEENY
ncbi:MAG: nicotinate-nucleotide--dimethylbenzimidazole phosphoribosyltransferase [Spirochaetales bacterium]|nr:nicotinate-nucleotide--dimethylbenzimidazole phosphoribosyltransferase [Spirochaetales bacterium]